MELQERDRTIGRSCGKETLGRRTGAGCDRSHRASRRQDQRDLRSRFRPRPGSCPRRRRGSRPRRNPAPAWHSRNHQGILQHRGAAHDLGQSGAKGFHAGGRRAVDIPGQGRRRRDPRQDQRTALARRLAELQRYLRHHQQSVRPRAYPRRLFRRILGSAGGGLRTAVARLRYRRLAAGAGVSLRRLCPQADLCLGALARAYAATASAAAARPRPRGDRADGAQRRATLPCCSM